MRQLILFPLFFLAFIIASHSQSLIGFGFEGGLNYNANGNYFESIGANAQHPDRNIGFHLGVFGKIGNRFYLKPELLYTNTKSDYNDDSFKMQKLDLPVLVGIRVIGPISVFAGPAFQYIIDTEFDRISINDVENDFSMGLNFGIGLNFKRFGMDLKYERGLSKNEATFVGSLGGSQSRIDTRPDQLILSFSLLL